MRLGYKIQDTRYRGFTLIEIIVSIVLISIIMIPIALMSIEYVRSIAYADSLTLAANLGRREMGVINNLIYTDPTLADGFDDTAVNYAGSNLDLRRTVNYVPATSNSLKRVRVRLFPSGTQNQLIELDTYVMDVLFGAGSAGGALGNEKDSFLASAGTLSRSSLSSVTLQNRRATGNITMTSVIITPTINKTLNTITMGGDILFSGSQPLPANTSTTVNLQKNFYMNSGMTYSGPNGGTFSFNNTNVPHAITVQFVFYDATQSAPYSWSYVK